MKKEGKKSLYFSLFFIAAFGIWTVLIRLIDVKEIGPQNSSVGFNDMDIKNPAITDLVVAGASIKKYWFHPSLQRNRRKSSCITF